MVDSGKILDVEEVYNMYCAIPEAEFLKIKNELTSELAIEIDTTLQMVGVAHNVLLDGMIKHKEVSSGFAETGSFTAVDGGESRLIDNSLSVELEVETFRDEFSTQLVNNNAFKTDFSDLVNRQLEKSKEGSVLEEANSMSEYVMNLFLEAYASYTTDPNDITSIVNYYHSQIEPSSELTQEEKHRYTSE